LRARQALSVYLNYDIAVLDPERSEQTARPTDPCTHDLAVLYVRRDCPDFIG
jgi:hypothetical protein